jgi:hypothetical protein
MQLCSNLKLWADNDCIKKIQKCTQTTWPKRVFQFTEWESHSRLKKKTGLNFCQNMVHLFYFFPEGMVNVKSIDHPHRFKEDFILFLAVRPDNCISN